MLIKLLTVGALAMVPVIELRGAVPLGIAYGLPFPLVFLVSVIGNMLPTPLIVLFVRKIFAWLRAKSARLEKLVSRMEGHINKKAEAVYKYKLLGLLLLVAIPLPGTGAWTGAMIGALLNIRIKALFLVILCGVIIAGIITSIITYGVKILII